MSGKQGGCVLVAVTVLEQGWRALGVLVAVPSTAVAAETAESEPSQEREQPAAPEGEEGWAGAAPQSLPTHLPAFPP